MDDIGEGIAFASLVAGCVAVDIYGSGAGALWTMVVIWVFCFGHTAEWIKAKYGKKGDS